LAPRTIEIPMSKFLELLEADQIQKVAVTEREIRGIAKPGALPAPPTAAGDRLRKILGTEEETRVFVTTRIPLVDDQQLVDELRAHNVEFAGRIETTFWKDLLFGWVIPLAVMVAIWMFLMRRVGGGPTQALDLRPQGAEDDLRRRGRRRRGEGGAGRDHRLPQEPAQVSAPRRPAAQGRPPRRSARHRQDAASPRGRG